MPNMSRRSLHSQERSTEHLLSDHKDQTVYSTPNSVKYRGRALFTDDNYNENYEYTSYYKKTTFFRKIVTFFLTLYTSVVSVFYRTAEYPSSWLLWFGKKVHRAASLLFLWDTWLLRVWDGRRKNNSKVSGVILLCLLPLLFFGGKLILLSHSSSG